MGKHDELTKYIKIRGAREHNLKGIDIEDYEALQYMQRVLEKSGIFNALREKGIEEGDIVSLYDIEFEYVP